MPPVAGLNEALAQPKNVANPPPWARAAPSTACHSRCTTAGFARPEGAEAADAGVPAGAGAAGAGTLACTAPVGWGAGAAAVGTGVEAGAGTAEGAGAEAA